MVWIIPLMWHQTHPPMSAAMWQQTLSDFVFKFESQLGIGRTNRVANRWPLGRTTPDRLAHRATAPIRTGLVALRTNY